MSKVVCIIGADPYSRNYGIRALFEGLLGAGHIVYPDANFRFVVGSKRESITSAVSGSSQNCREIILDYSKRIYRKNHILRLILLALLYRLAPAKKIRRSIASANNTFRDLAGTDVVFSISAGDSFSDLYGLSNMIYVSLPQLLFLLIGRPVYQMPQSYGPFNGMLARKIARFILCHSKAVLARECLSKKYLLKTIKTEKAIFCYDLGFLMKAKEPVISWSFNGDGDLRIGLNISGMLFFGGYQKEGVNPFNLISPYRDTIYGVIEWLMKREMGIHLFLVPNVPGDHFQSDQRACGQVFGELQGIYPGRIHLVGGHYDHRETKHIIGKMDFFIGSRMHACIAAISQSIPTLSMAYSDKFLGVMESIDYGDSVVDLRKKAFSEIRSCLEDMLNRRVEDGARIQNVVKKITPEIERTLKTVIHM